MPVSQLDSSAVNLRSFGLRAQTASKTRQRRKRRSPSKVFIINKSNKTFSKIQLVSHFVLGNLTISHIISYSITNPLKQQL